MGTGERHEAELESYFGADGPAGRAARAAEETAESPESSRTWCTSTGGSSTTARP